MAPKKQTQRTPKGKEIPVPKREQVMRDLRKVAKGSGSRRSSK